MARILTNASDGVPPDIDPQAVAAFFEERARRMEEVGPMKAVIYQDKQGDLAERRDAAEVERILPLLALDGTQSLLDVGCGTGRWTRRVVGAVERYHGIDATAGLLEHARAQHVADPHCRFTHMSADLLSPQALAEGNFDRILCVGICMYLNDVQLRAMFTGMAAVVADRARIVLREPMATGARLTLQEHYSEELEDTYHAIYRHQDELLALMQPLFDGGFVLAGQGDVYHADGLNNRAETKQCWLLLERT